MRTIDAFVATRTSSHPPALLAYNVALSTLLGMAGPAGRARVSAGALTPYPVRQHRSLPKLLTLKKSYF